jgi:hypothetical protein
VSSRVATGTAGGPIIFAHVIGYCEHGPSYGGKLCHAHFTKAGEYFYNDPAFPQSTGKIIVR